MKIIFFNISQEGTEKPAGWPLWKVGRGVTMEAWEVQDGGPMGGPDPVPEEVKLTVIASPAQHPCTHSLHQAMVADPFAPALQ